MRATRILTTAIFTLILFFSFFPQSSGAVESVTFDRVWQSIRVNSDKRKASTLDTQAAVKAEERAARHWLPRVYANGRTYVTDDPAQALMGELGQQQIGFGDLTPDALNHPGNNAFATAALGLDFPIYEGGAGVARYAAASRRTAAAQFSERAEIKEIYSRSARSFGTVLVTERALADVLAVGQQIDFVLTHYRVGSKANPVGYAGLLSLKAMKNRIEAMSSELRAANQAEKEALTSLGKDLPENWSPAGGDIDTFLIKYLPAPVVNQRSEPANVRSAVLTAESAEASAQAEKAKTLPRVGFFSEGYLDAGARAAATSYSAGAYVQWDIFSSRGTGAYDESHLSAQAASARADAARVESRIALRSAISAETAIEDSVRLLRSSRKLQREQNETSLKLFASGALPALELVDSYSRSLDVIEAIRQTELRRLATRETEANNGNIHLPGDQNE